VTVVLDPKLTPELTHEGLAREFTSVLQQGRKSARFEVSVASASGSTAPIQKFRGHRAPKASIADEVLAVAFEHGLGATGESADLNGRPVRYEIARA